MLFSFQKSEGESTPDVAGAQRKRIVPGECQALPEKPSLALFFQRWRGLKMPSGVMMPVINSGGVTSKAGLRAVLPGLATRGQPRQHRTQPGLRRHATRVDHGHHHATGHLQAPPSLEKQGQAWLFRQSLTFAGNDSLPLRTGDIGCRFALGFLK